MTTGRINQVTIVRRGWPPAHVSAPERCYKLLVGAPRWGAPLRSGRRLGAVGRRGRQSAFPLFVPQGTRRPHRSTLWVVWPRGPRRRTRPRSFSHSASAARGLSPAAQVVGLAIGQSPTEPIRRRREDEPPAAIGHPQYAVQRRGCRLRGGRFPPETLPRR
jgi:hypothetical protein